MECSFLIIRTGILEVSLDAVQEEYAVVLDSGTRINVSVADLASTTLSNLQSLLAQKIFVQSALNNFADLVSLDLRFDNKIFYKFKDVAPVPAVATSTATSS